MSELSKVAPVTVWMAPSTGPYSKDIWAPELHFYDGKFYLYFAGDSNNDGHRIYVLENSSPDPTFGKWVMKGKVADLSNDLWAIDASTFEYKGHRYIVWSGIEPGTKSCNTNIYIAELSNPWTLNTTRVKLSSPTYDWEMVGCPINEGPEALISPTGNLFLSYSGGGCGTDNYALGLLSLAENGSPLNATHWTKSPTPVFVKDPANGAYGPGHNGFFKSLDETQYWIIYHAKNQTNQGCGALRNPRIQQLTWNSNGTPNFGVPVKIGSPIPKPSGET
uniref:Uncharacterized protein n=1 Tax=Acrobeloides nanus TaxID=290746 RepID=A0A914CKY6_9BILA